MIRIGILGDIGSGKSYIAKNFGYPVFNADKEVGKLYKKNRKIFNKLQKALPKYLFTFPVDKKEITKAVLANKTNLRKIIKIVHVEIRKKMNIFLRNNRNKKIIILDIPLLLENKINKKNDILIFVEASKKDIMKNLRLRDNFNLKMYKKFKKIQLSLDYKKKKSNFVIKNNFSSRSVQKKIGYIIKEIL